jgi:hypothetical protein
MVHKHHVSFVEFQMIPMTSEVDHVVLLNKGVEAGWKLSSTRARETQLKRDQVYDDPFLVGVSARSIRWQFYRPSSLVFTTMLVSRPLQYRIFLQSYMDGVSTSC